MKFLTSKLSNSHKVDEQKPHVASGYRIGHRCSKVSKFFDLPQYSMKIVIILGDDVTVAVSFLKDIGFM